MEVNKTLFECAYCKEVKEEYGNTSHFVRGIICEKCNTTQEIPRRLGQINKKDEDIKLEEIQLMIKYGTPNRVKKGWILLAKLEEEDEQCIS